MEAGSPSPPELLQCKGACFVTLRASGRLRGCIGSLRAFRSLAEDVAANAEAAALRDPRFPPVSAEELEDIRIEVSMLEPVEQLDIGTERQLVEILQPGIDGLILEHGRHRATFLPAVWREVPEPEEFVRRLKIKAGLEPDFWSDEMVVRRYSTKSFRESTATSPGTKAGS
ncbi:MAG: AmmeMemoRadiSam system protein A [Acidobacteriota bacterium]